MLGLRVEGLGFRVATGKMLPLEVSTRPGLGFRV